MNTRHLPLLISIFLAALLATPLVRVTAAPAPFSPPSGGGREGTAATLYVAPGGNCAGHSPCYATIQTAVDAAGSGDTVLVAEGTYTGVSAHGSHLQVVYVNKRLTIRGGYTTAYAEPPDPAAHPTTLDAQGQGHVIYIPAIGSYAHLTLDGLRITGGYATEAVSGDDTGGGIRTDGVSGDLVTIQNCWIGENGAEEGGAGGIAFDFTELELIDSTVISNTGTGVILWASDSPIITGNTIAGSSAGGMSILSAEYGDGLTIQGNAFTGNAGNGLYLFDIDSDGGSDAVVGNTFDANDRGLLAHSVYANLRISDNTFQNNVNPTFQGYGGGARLELSNAQVLNNTFTANDADFGGGLSVGNAAWAYVLVQGNRFLSNTGGDGGAVHLSGECTTDLRNNLIAGNQARFGGGGVAVDAGTTAILRSNVLTGNQAKLAGGLYCGSCTATLEQNRIVGNSASTKGGGLWFNWPAFLVPQTVSTLTNNLIADNSAPTGGGLMIESSHLALIHNTIAHNLGGAGVYVARDLPTSAVLTNTILVSHTVGIQVASGDVSLEGTLWGDGAWANGSDWVGTVTTGTVNLWADPLFVAPAGGDYHLTAASPARDQAIDAGVDRDIDGELRPHPDTHLPDIGADEYHLDDLRVFLPLVVRNN